ncbi:MAG: hypothetical protein B7Z39_02595 [Novosphingobium sp. 12-64-8]|nr:MAG: hypothetical protein B7Z39_02595 [Novosphingobium sp. 12-64-8]
MRSWSGIPELIEEYRALGALRFWALMAALLAWVGGGMWLQYVIGWPDDFGFHCRGKGCLLSDLWHSPALVERGGVLNWALFIYFWTVPAVMAGSLAIVLWRRIKRSRSHLIDDTLSKTDQRW